MRKYDEHRITRARARYGKLALHTCVVYDDTCIALANTARPTVRHDRRHGTRQRRTYSTYADGDNGPTYNRVVALLLFNNGRRKTRRRRSPGHNGRRYRSASYRVARTAPGRRRRSRRRLTGAPERRLGDDPCADTVTDRVSAGCSGGTRLVSGAPLLLSEGKIKRKNSRP